MKKVLIICTLMTLLVNSNAQVLLEDKDGDKTVSNVFGIPDNNFSLVKLNTGDQSLGFNYFTSTKAHDPSSYKIGVFGIKAKPTEGYAAVFNNGQFSPGINLSYSLTQVAILADGLTGKLKPVDWGGVDIGFNVNKYSLYNKDTIFGKQIESKSFKGFNLTLNYNLLLKQSIIINFKIGYSRSNNYEDLTSVEVKDIKSIFDSTTATLRQTTTTKLVKAGNYLEFDAYPIAFSITRTTPTTANPDKLLLGYTFFIKNLISQEKPKTDMGIIFFLTRQSKNGVRSPVLGINFQSKDFFDVEKQNNGLLNRIQIGFTTNFSF